MEEVNNESSNEAQRNTNSHNEIRIVRRRQTAIRGDRSRFQLPTREVDHLQVSVDNNGEALVGAGRAVNGLPTVIEHQGNVNNYESQGKRSYKYMKAYVFLKIFDMSLLYVLCVRANLN
jgi:hypothetical protein